MVDSKGAFLESFAPETARAGKRMRIHHPSRQLNKRSRVNLMWEALTADNCKWLCIGKSVGDVVSMRHEWADCDGLYVSRDKRVRKLQPCVMRVCFDLGRPGVWIV